MSNVRRHIHTLSMNITISSIVVASFLLSAGQSVLASEATLGGTHLTIPEPSGFAPIADPESTLGKADRATDSPQFVTLSRLFPKAYEKQVQNGTASSVTRSLLAKTPRTLVSLELEPQHFLRVKSNSRRDCTPRDDIGKKLAEVAATAGTRLKEAIGHDPHVVLGVPVPLPVHDDTPNSIGCSFIVKVQGTSPDGKPVAGVLTFTNLDVLVRRKVAMLTVYGSSTDLEWTRSTARAWADSILAANASSSSAPTGRK